MGFNFFGKKQEPLLTQENKQELLEIKRKAYMEEARKIMEERGKQEAKKQLELKKDNAGWN